MTLFRPTALELDGTPVTGHTPTSLWSAIPMTSAQLAGVEHAYQQFRRDKLTSILDYLVSEVTLADGTRVRMESVQDQDNVMVWPAEGDEEARLYHGVAAMADWAPGPLHYHLIGAEWKFQGRAAQLLNAPASYNHACIFIGGSVGKYAFRPMVNDITGESKLWDYWVHKGAKDVPEDLAKTFPLVLLDETAGKHTVVYATPKAIFNAKGVELVRIPDLDGPEASTLTRFPPCANTIGGQAAIAQMRELLLSPTFDIWRLTFQTQRLQRAESTYALDGAARFREFSVPLPYITEAASDAGVGIVEPDPTDSVWTSLISLPEGSGGGFNPAGLVLPFPIVWVAVGHRWGIFDDYGINRIGGWSRRNDAVGDAQDLTDVLPAPGLEAVIGMAKVRHALNYPVQALWEGGQYEQTKPADAPARGYGFTLRRRIRRTAEWRVDGTPRVEVVLPWGESVALFEGVTEGVMDGHRHETTTAIANTYTGGDTMMHPPDGAPFDGSHFTLPLWPPDMEVSQAAVDWVVANRIDFDAIYADWMPGEETVPDVQDPTNTCSYSLKSRYILDFDSRIRFWAAIRVEASCPQAQWEQQPGSYPGHMVSSGEVEHQARVYLEWKLRGEAGETLLYERSFIAPPLGFEQTVMPNVLRWPAPDSEFTELRMTMPQDVTPPYACYTQLKRLMEHQGVNPNLAGSDYPPDDPPVTDAQLGLKDYEYSTFRDGMEQPHPRLPVGFLYGRTLKLQDVADAFWLFKTLDFDIGNPGLPIGERTPYYYMPDFPAALELQRRFELEGAQAREWSGRIPERGGETRPAFADRDVKLYYV